MNLAKLTLLFKKTSTISTMMLFVALLLSSCGYDKSNGGSEEVLSFSQSALTGGVPLDDAQMAVALRICYAFRTKRSKFLVEMLGESFDFTHIVSTCDAKKTQSSFSARLVQNSSVEPMQYESNFSGSYIKEVQTDLNGYLSDLCGNVLAGETPLNISKVNNELYEYRFQSSATDGDKVSITIGSKQRASTTSPSVTQKVVFRVLTNSTSSANFQGMLLEGTRYLPCESGDAESSKFYKQLFQAP